MTKVRAGHRMIRLCMFMKLIFLHSELEILLKKKRSETGVSAPVFYLVMTGSGYQGYSIMMR